MKHFELIKNLGLIAALLILMALILWAPGHVIAILLILLLILSERNPHKAVASSRTDSTMSIKEQEDNAIAKRKWVQ